VGTYRAERKPERHERKAGAPDTESTHPSQGVSRRAFLVNDRKGVTLSVP
jgi:hypothetical protein